METPHRESGLSEGERDAAGALENASGLMREEGVRGSNLYTMFVQFVVFVCGVCLSVKVSCDEVPRNGPKSPQETAAFRFRPVHSRI